MSLPFSFICTVDLKGHVHVSGNCQIVSGNIREILNVKLLLTIWIDFYEKKIIKKHLKFGRF